MEQSENVEAPAKKFSLKDWFRRTLFGIAPKEPSAERSVEEKEKIPGEVELFRIEYEYAGHIFNFGPGIKEEFQRRADSVNRLIEEYKWRELREKITFCTAYGITSLEQKTAHVRVLIRPSLDPRNNNTEEINRLVQEFKQAVLAEWEKEGITPEN